MKQNIMDVIDGNIEVFITKLAKVYDLPIEDLRVIWSGGEVQVVGIIQKDGSKVIDKLSVPVVIKKTQSNDILLPPRVCQHMWTKGDRKGTLCSCEVKNPLKSYCVKHVKLNADKPITIQAPIRIIPDMNNIKNKSKLLRRNKTIDKLWHEDTGMVFESIEDRRVVNRLVDGELTELTDIDIDTCKGMGFVIKPKPEITIGDIVKNTPIEEKTPDKIIVKKTDSIGIEDKPNIKIVDIVKNTTEFDRIKEVEDLLGQMQVSSYEEEEILEEEE
jgi:hypothetical protein